jgi:hypothetical protein
MLHETVVIEGEASLINQIDGDPDVCIGGGGSQPTGTKSILLTEAGTKTEDVADYAYAEINAVTDATASGAIASFSDGAEDVPMTSCVVDIEPVQSGSGDPSPSNVRPISGWSEVKVTKAGKNLIDSSFCTNRTQNGIKTVRNNDGSITITGTASSSLRFWNSNDTLNLTLKPGTYTLSPNLRLTKTGGYNINTFTLTEETTYKNIVFLLTNGQAYNETFYPQLEYGSTATAYEPYVSPTEYPISLGQTVYGGTLDVVSGVLTVTDGYIASYAGETLLSTWISDRDVYVQGTTPTTGAQVVYKLATPQIIQLTLTEIKTLLGSNSVWADSGDISVGYKADVYLTEGSTPTGTKQISITQNGTTTEDVTNYASAEINVNVPASAVDTGTKNINSNGTHDVVGYASAEVNVPNSYSASDEGKVVSNGALVAQTSDTVTENGTVDTTLIDELTVNVPTGGGGLVTVASGTYTGAGTNPSNAGMGINVGKKMPKTDFMFKIVARADSVYTYDANYKYAWGIAVIDSDIASFNLSSAGTSKQPVSAVQYDVDNSGTVTNVSAGSHVVDICTIRNTGASYTRANNIRIDQYSDRFEIRLFNSTPGYLYAAGIVYDWEIVYFGSNPSQDIVDLS